jgi:hypothetical protein
MVLKMAMAMAMRVVGAKEGNGDGIEGGGQVTVTATRVMATSAVGKQRQQG